MQTPTDALARATDKARAARFGVYPICCATCRIRCRVASLIPPRPCRARSTVPIETLASSAIKWIPRLSFFIRRSSQQVACSRPLWGVDLVHPLRRPHLTSVANHPCKSKFIPCVYVHDAILQRDFMSTGSFAIAIRSACPMRDHANQIAGIRIIAILCLTLLGPAAQSSAAQTAKPSGAPPYMDPSQPINIRVDDLVSRMTLEEKASQLVNQARAIPRLQVPAYDWWSEALHGVANAGTATVFPEPMGLAATFDVPLIHEMAIVIGTEARIKHNQAVRAGHSDIMEGLDFWSPNINIFRDPRWGRGQETYGEDPFLTARMGVAFVTGLQGDDPKYFQTIATPKHFAVHSGPESTRHTVNVDVSKHDMEDTYLPAFRAAITEGKAGSIMCAYNRVNAEPACANAFLLEDMLRGAWKFDGYVVSDCDAVSDIQRGHHFSQTMAEAAAISLKRGTDNDCADFGQKAADNSDYVKYVDAVKKGFLSEKEVDVTLKRLFTARFRLGLFDPPELVKYAQTPDSEIDSEPHRALALKLARESIVLLKNDGVLPLNALTRKIAVVGPLAASLHVLEGNYNGTPSRSITALEGIRKEFATAQVSFSPGTNFLL